MKIELVTIPPTGKTISAHVCHGTTERMFENEDGSIEFWTWCASCKNWWQSAFYTAEAVRQIEEMFEEQETCPG